MKIWNQHGSEHSANLVMIGHFADAIEAAKAKQIIDELTEQVSADQANGSLVVGGPSARYTDAMLDLLSRVKVHSIGAGELEQFVYDVSVKVEGSDVIVTTDESDVSAFLKVMFERGARVEVYSAHDYPNTAHGRGK